MEKIELLKIIEEVYSKDCRLDGVEWLDEDLANILLERFEQELDKAREEVLTELQEEFSEFGVPDDVRYTKPLFYINEIIEEKLSKLKE